MLFHNFFRKYRVFRKIFLNNRVPEIYKISNARFYETVTIIQKTFIVTFSDFFLNLHNFYQKLKLFPKILNKFCKDELVGNVQKNII
mgnify:CR=1 FL=1